METAYGVVALAQESRFLLACDDGRMRLMMLAPSAGIEPQDLPGLVRRACRVAVRHHRAEGRRAELAVDVAEV